MFHLPNVPQGSGQFWGKVGEMMPGFCPSPCTPGSPMNSFPPNLSKVDKTLLWKASHNLLCGSEKIIHSYKNSWKGLPPATEKPHKNQGPQATYHK